MKNKFTFILLLLIAFSCSTHQKVSFNKNWSGKVVTTIDMTQLAQLAGADAAENETVLNDSINKLKIESLKQIEGIKFVKIESNTNQISVLSYEFDDINALNASAFLFSQEMLQDPMHTFFKVNGKELEVNLPRIKSEENPEGDMGLGDQFLYQMELEFARKIKSFKSTCDTIIQNDNTLLIKTNLTNLSNKEKTHKTTIKLK
ncbi:MAG: hypothetical protein ACK5B9_04860 [Flavobacteriia bacterium]